VSRDEGVDMKKHLLVLAILMVPVPTLATPPEAKPTSSSCKMNLKEWSQQKTETLTITELRERMNTKVACADLSKKHAKHVRAYLEEFYRTHSELANRAFDFITRHGLAEQFGEEENTVSTTQAQSTAGAREQ
jgi:hypothetical protein